MTRLINLNPAEAKKMLNQKLKDCMEARRFRETRWRENEQVIYGTRGQSINDVNSEYNEEQYSDDDETIGINYAFKNFRFIHAQLSANPPTVVPRPTTNDPADRRRADAADRLIRYALREYQLQEVTDRTTLNTLLYGTGITKTIWDTEAGDIMDMDEETGELVMEGEFKISVPDIWDVYLDPNATCPDELTYVFERITIDWEEALYRFPDKRDILIQYRKQQIDNANSGSDGYSTSAIRNKKYDIVELYEYWEAGKPWNGFLGRYCICTANGDLVTDMLPNPERYQVKLGKGQKSINKACLPYQILTDIDVPQQIWGKASVEYNVKLQSTLNKIDMLTLENMKAHGVARIILPEGSEIADGSITNSPWDIVKITGTQPPHFMTPMPTPSIIPDLMARYKAGIDDMSGVNESMFGQQSRETSGFSMQYATDQGNMIRRRLFNKYVLFVEQIYKSYLRIIQKNWDTPHTISVLGKEKAFEAVDIQGSDLSQGFDIVVEYGASLSLDPTSRREEILSYMPLFEKAGVESRQILKMLKLNELSGMYDSLDLASDRQREVFETMAITGLYIAPEDLQDHKNMLQYCYYYLMTTEYKYLDSESKALVHRHVKEREQLAAQSVAAAAGAAPAAPAGIPGLPGLELPGQPPV